MHHYSVYGACLATTMAFPELEATTRATPKWTFATASTLPPAHDLVELGAEPIYGDVEARLASHRDGHRISVDDTGVFDLSIDRRRITWEERAESWPDFVRAHCIGRVLSTAMYLEGWLPLHGSAVAFDGGVHAGDDGGVDAGVVAFLAPKGFGKSSLALALAHAGARLVTDDTLPVELSAGATGVRAWPGVHSVRVREDAAALLGVATPGDATRDGKHLVTDLPSERRMQDPAPLRAIYLLDPVLAADAPQGVMRTALPPTVAALSIVSHVKIGRMLGAGAAVGMLARAAELVRTVPVYRLSTARELTRLPEIAASIRAWHGATA